MGQSTYLGTLLGEYGQMAGRAERALATRPTIAHPLRRQPCQRARSIEGKRVRRRVGTVTVRQALELTGHANERVVRLDPGAGVRYAQLWRVHHDVVDRTGTGQQGHLARHRVHPRRLHAQRGTGRPHRLAGAETDVDADTQRAQARKLAVSFGVRMVEATLLHECRNRGLMQR